VSPSVRAQRAGTCRRGAGRGVDVVRRAQPPLSQPPARGGSESRGVLQRWALLTHATVGHVDAILARTRAAPGVGANQPCEAEQVARQLRSRNQRLRHELVYADAEHLRRPRRTRSRGGRQCGTSSRPRGIGRGLTLLASADIHVCSLCRWLPDLPGGPAPWLRTSSPPAPLLVGPRGQGSHEACRSLPPRVVSRHERSP
jgi:hypothetical protein